MLSVKFGIYRLNISVHDYSFLPGLSWSFMLKLAQKLFLPVWLKMRFYAVHKGRVPGVYKSWSECFAQVNGFTGAKFKKFSSVNEAEFFVKEGIDQQTEEDLLQKLFSDELNAPQEKCLPPFVKPHSQSDKPLKRKLGNCEDGAKQAKIKNKDIVIPVHNKSVPGSSTFESCPIVYTDGACSKNGRKGCKAGYGVWWGDNHPLNLSRKLKGEQTNQRAEIAAVNTAIEQAIIAGHRSVLIKTDSMFIINCVTKWIPGWIRRNWLKADGKPVVHKKEFSQMLENMKDVKVHFEHVYGHQGVYGNEMADKLAVAGASL
ncbi:unnamed protein product [Clavelina lepadiformis]|uniref:Ribonuclease H1 n=1 Tax=Clavelina lepadiformis TaxID=159417 RepID=A0ABP0H5L1_CLALP